MNVQPLLGCDVTTRQFPAGENLMKRTLHLCCFLGILLAAATLANAGTKEEIMRLQSDVLALQNQLRMLEKTINEQNEGMRSLIAQLNDQMGKTNQMLGKITSNLENQSAGDRSTNQGILQEMRNLGTKLDDAATRISALAQQISDLKVQTKPISQRVFQAVGNDPNTVALSADNIYNEAFNDLIQGNFDLAIEGFTAFIKNFPSNEKADDAQYNIGEAYYNAGKIPQAIAAFTRVVNEYPTGDKVVSSLFKRGKAQLLMKDKESAAEDLKTVFEKYPGSPEANLAKTELENMGIDLTKPSKTAPVRRRKP
jgi:tol-pal system protein YbgF